MFNRNGLIYLVLTCDCLFEIVTIKSIYTSAAILLNTNWEKNRRLHAMC